MTKSSYYTDDNIFTALVHLTLDSLRHPLGQGISLVPRAPVSIVLARLTNIVIVQIQSKDKDSLILRPLASRCGLREAD